MKIRTLLFGSLRELIGKQGDTLELKKGATAAEVLSHYSQIEPRFAMFASSLAISVNHEYALPDQVLSDGDEVGLLPPVSGGSENEALPKTDAQFVGEVRIVREAIHSQAILARARHSSDGAAVMFDGVVRDNTRGRRTLYLDYEAYEPMALKQMESLAAEARQRFEVRSASIIHRIGRLEIGETSVLIVVAAAHRGASFDACRWIIDTLKKTVPIWKKEYFEDGAVWADGEPFPEEIRRPGGKASGSAHPTD